MSAPTCLVRHSGPFVRTAVCCLLTSPFRYTPSDGRVRGMTLKLSIIGNGQQSMGDATLDDILACLEQKSGVVWIDASGPSIEEIDAIGKLFHFHALSLEDAHRRHQRPKIDQYDGYLFIVFYVMAEVDGEIRTEE